MGIIFSGYDAKTGDTHSVSQPAAMDRYQLIRDVADVLDINGHQGVIEDYTHEAHRIAAKYDWRQEDRIAMAMVYGEVLAFSRKFTRIS